MTLQHEESPTNLTSPQTTAKRTQEVKEIKQDHADIMVYKFLPEHAIINKDDLLTNIHLLGNFDILKYLKVKPTCCAFYNEFISYSL